MRTSGLTAMPSAPVSGRPIPHGVPFPGYTLKPGSPRTRSETRPVRTAMPRNGTRSPSPKCESVVLSNA